MTDDELRRRFHELKRRDQARMPVFQRMWTSPRPARPVWRPVVGAVAAAILLWFGAKTVFEEASPTAAAVPRASSPEPSSVALDPAPLDFLLDGTGDASRALLTSRHDSNPLAGW